MRIYVKEFDMNLRAPQEKWVFSHYSTSQQEIKEEVRRTFQTINALQPNLTTDKCDIINFLNKGDDTAPLAELNRRKNNIYPNTTGTNATNNFVKKRNWRMHYSNT